MRFLLQLYTKILFGLAAGTILGAVANLGGIELARSDLFPISRPRDPSQPQRYRSPQFIFVRSTSKKLSRRG